MFNKEAIVGSNKQGQSERAVRKGCPATFKGDEGAVSNKKGAYIKSVYINLCI